MKGCTFVQDMLGKVQQPIQENILGGRVQEGLYITVDFSSPKLSTLTTYLGQVKQPMLENRSGGIVHEAPYITDGFFSPKLYSLTTYLGQVRLRNQCKRIDLEAQYRKEFLMVSLLLNSLLLLLTQVRLSNQYKKIDLEAEYGIEYVWFLLNSLLSRNARDVNCCQSTRTTLHLLWLLIFSNNIGISGHPRH